MHPVLLQLGPLLITGYSFCIGLGILLGAFAVRSLSRRTGVDPEPLYDLAFWGVLGGIAGARLLYVLVLWPHYAEAPRRILELQDGGFVFLGGLFLGGGAVVLQVKRGGLAWGPSLDVIFGALPLTHGLGRVGCFLAGCCHGGPTDLPWGVRFPGVVVPPELRGIPVHPTQLYEAAFDFLLFAALWIWAPNRKRPGSLALAYFLAYPVARFAIELVRGDPERGFVLGGLLSTSQALCVAIFAAAAFGWSRLPKAPEAVAG